MRADSGARARFAELVASLRAPVVAAPMFLVSGPEMVVAACRAGIVGAFPTPNARTMDDLEEWLGEIVSQVGGASGTWAVNMIVHRTYDRLDRELALLADAAPPLVIAALGNPRRVVDETHAWGGLVLADVSSPDQARRALNAGADGLVVVCAGAGGHTGQYSPFALLSEIRGFWDGPLVAGGGVGAGAGVLAMQVLGADLVTVGTRFLATSESRACVGHQELVIGSDIEDIVTSDSVTGVPASWLRSSLERHATNGVPMEAIDFSGDIGESKAWRDVWSAGQAVGAVRSTESLGEAVDVLAREYGAARARYCERPHS